MNRAEVNCSRCGGVAILLSVEGEFFPIRPKVQPKLIQVIECPQCGRLEQPEGEEQQDATGSPLY